MAALSMRRAPEPAAPARHARDPRIARLDPRARVALLSVGAAAVVVAGAAVWLTSDALRAHDELVSARADLARLQDQVRAGDDAGARRTIAALQARTRAADRATHGPVWTLAGQLPGLGRNVDALQTVSSTVDGLTRRALPSLMDATHLLSPEALAPVDGRIDLDPLTKAAPTITGADQAMRAAVQQLAGIDTHGLNGQVADAVDQVRSGIGDAATTTATAARAVQLLPAMLGADGTRNYLVLVQNNAEPRATGGIPGVVLLLRAQDGKVTQVDERSGASLRLASSLPLDDDEKAIFSPLLGTDMRDVTFTPDFPRSAALAKGIWESKVGGAIDGVVSVDPGTLALVLQATGPVPLSDGTSLTADNAVQRLLNTVYLDIRAPQAQDDWFASAASRVFDKVLGGVGTDAQAVLDRLGEAARQGRLMIWSAHDDEQARLTGTVLGGDLRGVDGPDGLPPTSPVIGVYLNDGTAAKMGYYENLTIEGKSTACRPDGSQIVHLDIRLTNTAPADASTTLPRYVLGPTKVVPWGSVKTNVLLYGPLGGRIEGLKLDPGPQGAFAQIHHNLTVAAVTTVLAPGQSRTFSLDVSTAKGQVSDVQVRSTPLARQGGATTVGSACSV
ncbi:DUF4012 domain-containing protein [Cellulomonas alba]|uniref:DUF4012 domain-containing protein n=1 Tax=Cellulomonas alba TaxID=3053467 RepID=A0ABT7SH36_9CELL|nr:DUF4012 domain-containing protein [Cellulomonas alba]MDM7855451.1 DUF4012 domain-containing protein [Cellulomonas alba]